MPGDRGSFDRLQFRPRSGHSAGLGKVLGQDVLDVHEQELLVLLLMIETELHELAQGGVGDPCDELRCIAASTLAR